MAIKRQAASSASGIAKKQKQCAVVKQALLAADNFPEKVLQMVSGNLPDCLGVPKEERHACQEQVIGMVGEVLTSVQETCQKSIEAAEAKLSSASEEKASRDQAHEAAASAVTTKSEAVATAKAAASDSVQAVKTAKVALASAEAEQQEGDKDLVDASDKKQKLEAALRESYMPLKEGGVEADLQKKIIAALVKLGTEFQLDSSMLTTLPSALAKAPSDRGSFDAMVFDTLGDELNKRIKQLEETLASGESAKAERTGKVQAAKSALETAQTNAESCKGNLEQGKTELDTAKADHKSAASALSQFGPEMKQVEKDLAAAKAKLASFTEGALASYEELLKLTNFLPPPAVVAETEPPAPSQ